MSTIGNNYLVPSADPNNNPLIIGAYYKSSNQILASGSVAVTFDTAQVWNNTNQYITHTPGTSNFVVVQEGLYQVEFALTVAPNGATWTSNRSASINIVRGTNNALLQQTVHPPSNTNYACQVTGTLYLLPGDVVRCVHNGVNTAGSISVTGIQNVFDYNTTFTWTFIR